MSSHPWLALPLSAFITFSLACGGSAPPVQTQSSPVAKKRHRAHPEVTTSAEVGALPEEEAQYALRTSLREIQSCFMTGSRRLEFLGGQIALNVTVSSSGKVQGVFAERSTLGDRETEKCMFDAMKHADWPKPVGGPIGVAQGSFDFDMSEDVRPPVSWQESRVASTVAQANGRIARCKAASRANYQATVYVGTDGKAISAGVSAPTRDAEGASDCLVEVLLGLTFPEPGSWPAKVSFPI